MTTFPTTTLPEVARGAQQSGVLPFIASRDFFTYDVAETVLPTEPIAALTHEPNENPTHTQLAALVTIDGATRSPHCARRLPPRPVCSVGFLLGTSDGGVLATAMQADVLLVLLTPINKVEGTEPKIRYQRKIIGRIRPNTDLGADQVDNDSMKGIVNAATTDFAAKFFAAAYANQIAVVDDRSLTPGLQVNGAGAHGIATVSFETEGATHLEIWANCRGGCAGIVPFFRTW